MKMKCSTSKILWLYFHFMCLKITLHASMEIFTVTFSISAMTEFINIRNFASLCLKNATCYGITVATFGISDLNSGALNIMKWGLKFVVQHSHKKCIVYLMYYIFIILIEVQVI
jgi:hypothetical protein